MPIQVLLFRLARPFVAIASAAALLTVLAASPASAGETKMFVGEKICRPPFVTISPPNPGGYCLITQANIPFLKGAKDYYTDPTVTRSSTGAYCAGGTTSVTGFSISRRTSAMNCAAVAP